MSSKIEDQVKKLDLALEDVEKKIKPILEFSLHENLIKLNTLERCKIEALIAYSLNTLIYIFIRINGFLPQSHPVMNELKRIQNSITKINEAEESSNKRKLVVDSEAAKRFIKHAVESSNN
ncbi:Nuclear nucleic acid-binding protein C1D [Smittium culicis]|uniref:Exosome complex protein n=1 Tax=Smittium culicis TaxID=133412 RepID=A0A1R1Y2B5_9FUNG|nr:Nuclear nucleic acid-binding protein C1D [Smittium culicis]